MAQDTLSCNLQDLFRSAEIHNREVSLSSYDQNQQELDLKASRISRLPQVSLRGSADYATNMPIYDNGLGHTPSQHDVIHFLYNTGADFYLNLYQGSRNELNIKVQQIKAEISAVKHTEATAQAKLDICYAYLELYRQYVFLDVIKADIEEQQRQLKEINDLYHTGVVLHSDVLRIELELSKREYLQVEIVNDIKQLSQKLQLLAGLEKAQIIRPQLLETATEISDFESNLETANEQAYSLQISELNEQITGLETKQERASLIPQLSMVGSFTFANPQIFLYPYNASWYTLGLIGFRLKIPLSNLYMNKPAIQKAQIEELKEEEMHLHLQDQLKNELLEADLNYNEATIKRGICEKNISLTEENLRIIKENYFQSTALITDLLDANMNYLKSLFELETAKMNQLQYYYQIQFLKGEL